MTTSILWCLQNYAYSQEGKECILHLHIGETLIQHYLLDVIRPINSTTITSITSSSTTLSEQALLTILSICMNDRKSEYLTCSEFDARATSFPLDNADNGIQSLHLSTQTGCRDNAIE